MYLISALIILSLGLSHCFFMRAEFCYPGEAQSNVPEEWIEQPLDHFNANNETWKMRYFKRLTFWKPNGPIYLFINGEYTALTGWIAIDSLLMCQLANETNGALFLAEHRYYGESMPVEIKDTSSMKYLSSKQALADVAKLIKFIKSAPEFQSSKVVVIGGSYAGNLAAWMRALYPDLVDGAVSSSAPVLAKKDNYEYLEAVSDAYEKYGTKGCLDKIKTMFKQYAELLKTSEGIKELKRDFSICTESDLSVIENQELLFYALIADYGNDCVNGIPDWIKTHCRLMHTNNFARSMQRSVEVLKKISWSRSVSTEKKLFQLNQWPRFTPSFKGSDCVSVNFTDEIESLKANKTDWSYSWSYQQCTEFGYYQTTTSKNQPFVSFLPLDFYIKICQGLFGEDFNEKRVNDGIAQTNALYGGVTPNVTNVVFTHGDMDPWHRLGVLRNLSETAVVRLAHATSHCDVLFDSYIFDPIELIEDRKYVKNSIKKWINFNETLIPYQ